MAFLREWFKTLMIRPKLILAFAAMALMTAFCGVVGYFFVDRVGRTVSVFSDVTSPLLSESLALVDSAQRMRAVFLGGLDGADSADPVSSKLKKLHAEGQGHLENLRRLAAHPGIDLSLEVVTAEEGRFAGVLDGMLAAHRRERAAAAATKDSLDRFSTQRHDVALLLVGIARASEDEVSRRQADVETEIEAGAATMDSLAATVSDLLGRTMPTALDAERILGENRQIADIAERLLPGAGGADLDALAQRARAGFVRIGAIVDDLDTKLRNGTGRAAIDGVRRGLAGLEAVLLGPDGLFASQRAMLAARADALAGQTALDQVEARYLENLDEIVAAVSAVNQRARLDADNSTARARVVIGASVLAALAAGLGLGLFFAHRLSAPAMRLAAHAETISSGGELVPLPDAALTGRADELGQLARAFNRMIVELAAARQRLIDWSEAEIRTQFERLNAAINNMPQGLVMFDAERNLIICNKRYAEIYSLDPQYTVPGTPMRTLIEDHIAKGTGPAANEDAFVDARLKAISEGKPYYYVNEMRDGHVIAISSQPMANGGMVTTHEDVTERRKIEARIAYMAHHDTLTGLNNRVSLREEMDRALAQVERGAKLAVLCLDLDHFKSINDTLGHLVGDALLQAVADRVRACVRPNDIVARPGGDEFTIIQIGVEQPVGSTALAARLIRELTEPYDVLGHQAVIGTSVGISIAPNDGTDPDRLMKNADMALYRAKEDGRGVYRFFEKDMDERMQRRRTLELGLRRAVVTGEFEVFYQPTIRVDTGRVASFEALLRWHHPERGLLLPDEFIPLAEEIGLINPIGAWVLKQACREAIGWPDAICVAVNLSPVQFKSGTLVLDVVAALGASGLPAKRLELEITETVLLEDTETTIGTLNQLRDLGVRIAMDDFGTGYSSLGYLRKFSFDKIKIDRSFIRDMDASADSAAIVHAVAGLSSTLGMATTAEGVETEEQLAKLTAEGCTEVQGFLFSEAKPAAELGAFLTGGRMASKAVA